MKISITSFLLLASLIESNGADVPTAYITAGGGFKTMTLSMGIVRAIYEQNILPLVTHWGCVSGGCWFQNQFSYSGEFYQPVIGSTGLSVRDAIADWGTEYSASMKKATVQGLIHNISYTYQSQSKLCPLDVETNGTSISDVIETALNDLALAIQWPAYNWYYYVDALIGSTVPGGTVKTFKTERKGYPYGTIVAGVTLPPNIFDNTASVTPSLSKQTPNIDLLPISFSAVPGEDGEWEFPSTDVSDLQVTNGKLGNKETVDLGLSPRATLAEVSAATSSAAGFFGSPKMFDNAISSALNNPRFDNLTFVEKQTLKAAIQACEPLGLQNTSSPVIATTSKDSTSWNPPYRYLDGGYSEDSGLVHSIRRMQKDCENNESGEFDCDEGVRAVLTYGAAVWQFESVPRLFADCDCGNSEFDYMGNAINPQIFAEPFPTDLTGPGWTLYDNTTYSFATEASLSYAWRGTVTTVENDGYNIKAGTPVDLVMIFADLPSEDPVIWPGFAANWAFSTFYGTIAQENYEALTPYLADVASDWNSLDSGRRVAGGKGGKIHKRAKKTKSKGAN